MTRSVKVVASELLLHRNGSSRGHEKSRRLAGYK